MNIILFHFIVLFRCMIRHVPIIAYPTLGDNLPGGCSPDSGGLEDLVGGSQIARSHPRLRPRSRSQRRETRKLGRRRSTTTRRRRHRPRPQRPRRKRQDRRQARRKLDRATHDSTNIISINEANRFVLASIYCRLGKNPGSSPTSSSRSARESSSKNPSSI